MFRHGTQTMDNSRICSSMSMVSKTSCSHFSGQGSYHTTHTWTNKVMSWISGAYESLCMALTWSELDYFAWFDGTVCDQPALSRILISRSVVCSSIVLTFLARVQIWNPFIQFKFSVYGLMYTHVHTYASCNPVLLVWGSLMLTPTKYLLMR